MNRGAPIADFISDGTLKTEPAQLMAPLLFKNSWWAKFIPFPVSTHQDTPYWNWESS